METLIISLRDYGYHVIVLTTCSKGDFHFELERNNIRTFSNEISNTNSLVYYIKQFYFLVIFCRTYKIDFLHSHLQHANIIAVFAQFFIKAKCVIFRHHCNFLVDNKSQQNKTESFFDRIIHVFSKKIVVPSYGVKNEIELNETKNIKKYSVLPYIYNFGKYDIPNPIRVEDIKSQFKSELILLYCSRFIELKRPFIALKVTKQLIQKGLNVKLLMLDDGSLRKEIEKYILDNNLTSIVSIVGFRKDYIDFFKASDILLHPSLTDASNSTVKEMALLEKCVITCKNTGDFDEYIVNEINGYLVSKENTENEMVDIISNLYSDKNKICNLGKKLRDDVLLKFSNSRVVIEKYIKETL